jgi:hypothetical protein
MRLAPACHGGRHGQRARQRAAIGHLGQAALGEGGERAERRRAPAAVDVADAAGLGVPDQPERVAANSRHVRVEHRQRRTRGNRGIDRAAAGAQHLDARLRGKGMRGSDQSVRRARGRTAGMYVNHEKFLGRFVES